MLIKESCKYVWSWWVQGVHWSIHGVTVKHCCNILKT